LTEAESAAALQSGKQWKWGQGGIVDKGSATSDALDMMHGVVPPESDARTSGSWKGVKDWFNAPPPSFEDMNPGPQSKNEMPEITVENNNKVSVYLDGAELKSVMADFVNDHRFYDRSSYGGQGLVGT